MYKVILALSFFYSINVNASTQLTWVQKVQGQLDSGYCVEVNENTNLENYHGRELDQYSVKVRDEKCKPKDTSLLFNTENGKCYEVDTETNGQKYFKKMRKVSKCRVMETTFQIRDGKCYEIDTQSQGNVYYAKVKAELCFNKESRFIWERNTDKVGTCYKVNSKGENKMKVKKEVCRPEAPRYLFVRTSAVKGYCLEQSADPGNEYSVKIITIACKPNKTSYFFFKESDRKSGKCFEVDSKTKGDRYIKKVEAKLCK